MNENTIQSMARRVRYRNIQGGGWPGKPINAPAVTRFPNILAEIEASGMWLWCPAQHARVSKEIMAAVLEDNEDLTLGELRGLCRLYGREVPYMIAKTLQMIDPATNKGKRRLWDLLELMEQTAGLEVIDIWNVERVRHDMERGEPVTYAAWRQACQNLNDALRFDRCKVRTARGVTA